MTRSDYDELWTLYENCRNGDDFAAMARIREILRKYRLPCGDIEETLWSAQEALYE